jgi:hypothetical protein
MLKKHFILILCIIILSLFIFNYIFKENFENKKEEEDRQPRMSLQNYEQDCRKCCFRNRKREDCIKNCFSKGFKCLCC